MLVTVTDRKVLTIPVGNGTENGGCQSGSALDILNIYVRNTDLLYTARQEINFLPNSFETGNANDQYEAIINLSLVPCITQSVSYIAGSTSIPQGSYFAADVVSATDYYPFGLTMTGRSLNSENARYGFNGKEKDKSINSLTAYDYGFRIYNPSIAKFLSVDPLVKTYLYFTPYQFASNNPIAAIDLDGLEAAPITSYPSGRLGHSHRGDSWKIISENDGDDYFPNQRVDATLYHIVDTKKVEYWILLKSYQANCVQTYPVVRKEYFYFNKPPSTEEDAYNGGTWKSFLPQDQVDANSNVQFANNAAKVATGAAVVITGGIFLVGAIPAVTTAAVTYGPSIVLRGYGSIPAVGAIGRLGAEFLDETGAIGAQNSAVSFFTSKVVQKEASFLYSTFDFVGTSGKSRTLEFGGELIKDGKDLILTAASYVKGLSSKEGSGELGREGLNALKREIKEIFKGDGFNRVIVNYERSSGSSSKNPGSTGQFIIDLTTE